MPPDRPGVYAWRGVLSIDDNNYGSKDAFNAWIHRAVSRQYVASVDLSIKTDKQNNQVTIRDNFVRVRGLEVGGGDLKTQHKQALDKLSDSGDRRRQLTDLFFTAANLLGPIIYVGQSADIRERVYAHLNGQTALLSRLREVGMTTDDIALHYLELPTFDKSERCAVEAFLTNLSVSPLVRREG